MKFCMYLLMTIGHPGIPNLCMPQVTSGGPGHSPKRGKFDVFFALFWFLAFFSKIARMIGLKFHPVVPQDRAHRMVLHLRARYTWVEKNLA